MAREGGGRRSRLRLEDKPKRNHNNHWQRIMAMFFILFLGSVNVYIIILPRATQTHRETDTHKKVVKRELLKQQRKASRAEPATKAKPSSTHRKLDLVSSSLLTEPRRLGSVCESRWAGWAGSAGTGPTGADSDPGPGPGDSLRLPFLARRSDSDFLNFWNIPSGEGEKSSFIYTGLIRRVKEINIRASPVAETPTSPFPPRPQFRRLTRGRLGRRGHVGQRAGPFLALHHALHRPSILCRRHGQATY